MVKGKLNKIPFWKEFKKIIFLLCFCLSSSGLEKHLGSDITSALPFIKNPCSGCADFMLLHESKIL